MAENNPFSSFADPDSFLGKPVVPRIKSSIGRMFGSMASNPPAPVAGIGRIPEDGGAAQGRTRQPEAPTPTTTTLPSGTPMVGFDSYPIRQAATTAQPPPTLPPLSFPLTQASVGGNLITQPPIRNTTLPFALTESAKTVPDRPSYKQIETPYGSVYASTQTQEGAGPSQSQLFSSRPTAFEGRTPEQQQALLAKVRQGGMDIRESYASAARDSFKNRTEPNLYTTPSGAAISAPTDRYGKPISYFENAYSNMQDKLKNTSETSSALLAGTTFGERQKSIGQGFEPRGPLLGGPQPAAQSTYASPQKSPFGRQRSWTQSGAMSGPEALSWFDMIKSGMA